MTTVDALPHWEDEPDLYDSLFLGGQRMPGICTVEIERKVKIDKKSPKGKNKATLTKQGVEAAEVSINIRVLDRDDALSLYGLMDLLEPVPDKEKATAEDALDIVHWAATYRKIEAIVIESTKGPVLKDGILSLDIKAIEFSKPKPAAKGTGTGGAGAGNGTTYLGVFFDQHGAVLPGSRVAVQGSLAVDAKGKPIKGAGGEDVYSWSQIAISDGSPKGYSETTGTFVGVYFGSDKPLTDAWNAEHAVKDKDVTKTPKKSKGGADLGDFDDSATNPADPGDADVDP